LVSSGLTVDLRLFDFPAVMVFLLVGVAVGWSDRHKRQKTKLVNSQAESELNGHV
jgi:hypothetical protein